MLGQQLARPFHEAGSLGRNGLVLQFEGDRRAVAEAHLDARH